MLVSLVSKGGRSAARRRSRTWCLRRPEHWPSTRTLSSTSSFAKHASQCEMDRLRDDFSQEIRVLAESHATKEMERFLDENILGNNSRKVLPPDPPPQGYNVSMDKEQIRLTLDAGLATFCLHVESRIAALVGKGFYTIGPCGEEALSSVGVALQPQDAVALHYRHLGINLAGQLLAGESMENLLLDRARGYTVSRMDPVTRGVHCSIGSGGTSDDGNNNYIVTSTLASQCPAAVGRALGYAVAANSASISKPAEKQARPISLATIGDGSVHNHHFWSSFHLARHAKHKGVKCSAVFGISDNGLSISYATDGYCDTLFDHDQLIPLYRANGNDMMDVYSKSMKAFQYSRQRSSPCVLLFKNLVRRFGHAASDRQIAYLDEAQIKAMADESVLETAMVQAVEVYGAITYPELRDRFTYLQEQTRLAFNMASEEDKVNREDMKQFVSAPAVRVPRLPGAIPSGAKLEPVTGTGKREVMRKHMNRVIDEVMEKDDTVVYLGEDVVHGGYYVVTEGLAHKYPGRVLDFPPDETSLLGAAMGFSQLGLTPIVELPYSKYLDCGADMFYEIAVMNWLTGGQRPNGMVVRLQGFDRGLFGGNFHTHNMLPHMPPGVDVVCYSNGQDYVRGFRHAIAQAKAGRVVMSVDCTNLLNLRHLHGKDRGWETVYPSSEDPAGADMMGFDDVRSYGTTGKLGIVTYGNGVVTALQTRAQLVESMVLGSSDEIDIIDCPYLSDVPEGLREVIPQYDKILFADICKEGPGSNVLSSTAISLHGQGLLPAKWSLVCAPRVYNPLGSTCTFLNVDDIAAACKRLL